MPTNPQLTPLDREDRFIVVEIGDIVEILNDYFPDLLPVRERDEFIRQLIDYANQDTGMYMARMLQFVPTKYQYLADQGRDLQPLTESFMDCAVRMHMRISELRLYRPGEDPTGFPYYMEVVNGDSVIIKYSPS